jgi:AraC-like DNA-binding protein
VFTESIQYRIANDGVELLEAAFDRHVYERHFHESYAIGATLRGVQRFWCRGETHDSLPGNVILIGPGDVHDGRSGAPGGYAYRMLYVSVDRVERVLADATGRVARRLDHRNAIRTDSALARKLNLAWRAINQSPASLAAEQLLDETLLVLAAPNEQPRLQTRVASDQPAARRVRDYLHEHFEPVGVCELAALASMSRFQLTRQFHQLFGLPLHAYHMQLRLHEAKRRLSEDQDVASVANELGFADQSHLHRRFKGAFGLTPGQWRRVSRADRRTAQRSKTMT